MLNNYMSNTCKAEWEPTQEQIDNQILHEYAAIAKKSIHFIDEFQCTPEYVAVILRDIADALIPAHSESENKCFCY